MRLEKWDEWYSPENLCIKHYIIELQYYSKSTWNYQQKKIEDILEYISAIGHQKELDHFLKTEKGWDI